MPFIEYHELEDTLVFYTMLRDPIQRYVSMYKHEARSGWARDGFVSWMRNWPRDNFQVRRIAGEENLDVAKHTLAEKMRMVGLLERYNDSLLILRQRLGVPHWNVAYDRPWNVGKDSDAFKDLPDLVQQHREEIRQRNSLDILLYEFARNELWPTYVSDYGGSEKLEMDRQATFSHTQMKRKTTALKRFWRNCTNRSYRHLVYKPLVRLSYFIERRRAEKHASAGGQQAPQCR